MGKYVKLYHHYMHKLVVWFQLMHVFFPMFGAMILKRLELPALGSTSTWIQESLLTEFFVSPIAFPLHSHTVYMYIQNIDPMKFPWHEFPLSSHLHIPVKFPLNSNSIPLNPTKSHSVPLKLPLHDFTLKPSIPLKFRANSNYSKSL